MSIKKSIYNLVSTRSSGASEEKSPEDDNLLSLIRSATDIALLTIHNNELLIILDYLNNLTTPEKAYDACLKIGSETPIIKPPLLEVSGKNSKNTFAKNRRSNTKTPKKTPIIIPKETL